MSTNRAIIFTFLLIAFGAIYFGDENAQKQFKAYKVREHREIEDKPLAPPALREVASTTKVKTIRKPAQRSSHSIDDGQAQRRASKFLALQRARTASIKRKKESFDFVNETGEGFALAPDLHAVPISEGEIRDAQEVSGHYIVPGSPGASSYHVVKTERGTYAVFTGIIKVMHEKDVDPYQIANDFGGEVSEVYEHINSVFLKYYDYSQAIKAHESLVGADGIKNAHLEVLEHGRQPR